MTEIAGARTVDFRTGAQGRQRRGSVGRVIMGGGRREVATGPAHTPVVEPQAGNAASREFAGDGREDRPAGNRLVAILRSRSGQQDEGGERPFPVGQTQRTGEHDPAAGNGHFHIPADHGDGFESGLEGRPAALHGQRTDRALGEVPLERVGAGESGLVARTDGREVRDQVIGLDNDAGGGNFGAALVDADEDAGEPVALLADMKLKTQLRGTEIERAAPGPDRVGRRCGARETEREHQGGDQVTTE